MTIEEVLREMRDSQWGLSPQVRAWADAIEAAMREPVAERILGHGGLAWNFHWADPPLGTKLYALPPDAQAELRDKDEELDFLRSVKESRGKELDEKDAEIERLTEDNARLRGMADEFRALMVKVEQLDEKDAEIERLREALEELYAVDLSPRDAKHGEKLQKALRKAKAALAQGDNT